MTEQLSLAERMARNPDGVLEHIAREHGVSTLEVAVHLPPDHCTRVDGAHLPDVLDDVTSWGEVMIIIHSDGLVAEVKSALPPASRARGYYNFHGDTPFGGHLKEDACMQIAFIDRPFMGRRSASIQFFDAGGTAIFKIFVARDAARELLPDQLERFSALRRRFARSA